MSFFDEVDEPPAPPRTAQRRRRPAGGGRRPPSDQPPTDRQTIRVRQGVGLVVLIVVVVLAAIGIHSCQVSQRNSALTSYANNVTSLIQGSSATSQNFFGLLAHAKSSSTSAGASGVQSELNAAADSERKQLTQAQGWSVPSEMSQAQQDLVTALRMRVDGMTNIASNIQPALSNDKTAINAIAAEMARLYASDVFYKDYAAPAIASALNAGGIAVGGANGIQISQQQFVPDVRWVEPTFVASQIGVNYGPVSTKVAPGAHGHKLNTVSVGGATLTTGAKLAAGQAPTFTLNFQNTGQNTENNVVCKVTLTPASGPLITGQKTLPQTLPGQTYDCPVTLPAAPPAGSATVTATIERVQGEKSVLRNTQTFQVTVG